MIYTLNGVEIQYRECQILRDTAKKIIESKEGDLLKKKAEWIRELRNLAENNPKKQKCAYSLSKAIESLPEDRMEALSEYVNFLVEKGKGIDVMVPFTAKNLQVILPVNTHEGEVICTD